MDHLSVRLNLPKLCFFPPLQKFNSSEKKGKKYIILIPQYNPIQVYREGSPNVLREAYLSSSMGLTPK